ncbi:MAG TPA: hypothetical protein VF572_05370 [Candidatus Saccharimonadales bacterium]|jgi:hypothetical protein
MSEGLRIYLGSVSERFLLLTFGIMLGIGSMGGYERSTTGGFPKGLYIAAFYIFIIALIVKLITLRRKK